MNESQTGSGWRAQTRMVSWAGGSLPNPGDKAGALLWALLWSQTQYFAAVGRRLAVPSSGQRCLLTVQLQRGAFWHWD